MMILKMIRIDPHSLYTSEETRDMLKGVLKLETLRRHGLVGLPSGYFGKNILDSIEHYCENQARQRGTGKVKKETHLEPNEKEQQSIFDNRTKQNTDGEVHSQPRGRKPVEGQRERFRRQLSQDPDSSK